MENQQAYRLGSMPRRVYRERCNPRWPEEKPCRNIRDLLDEWLAALADVKGKPLVPEVEALKMAVEAEHRAFVTVAEFEKQRRRYEILQAMGETVDPPTPPATDMLAGPDSLELARDLIDKAEGNGVTAALPADVCPPYELGLLIAQCRYVTADETKTLRIAELVRALASEEWLTGRLESAPQTELIHDIVMSRLDILNELLSTRPWPAPRPNPDGQARISATHIGQSVAQQLRPEFRQIRHEIADYAELTATDRREPVAPIEPLLTIPQAMKTSGLSRRKLQALLGEGRIKFKLVSKRRMVIPESLRMYLSSPDRTTGLSTENPLPRLANRRKIPDHLGLGD